MGFEVGLGSAFFAGLLAFVSPCILPMVPIFLCYIAGIGVAELDGSDGEISARRLLPPAVAFVAGFTVVFVALGATASSIGRLLNEHIALAGSIAGVVTVAMGLHFLGLVRIPLLYRSAGVHVAARPATLFGAFVFGLAFAFGWSPCAGPVLAAVLFLASAESSVARGSLLLFAYGLGTGIPFLLTAAFAGTFLGALRRFRRHLPTVEKVTGGFLVALGLVLFSGRITDVSAWLLDAFPVLGRIG
jgi:cytochrome c-type biogenesis protein